jgi:hypothetical protein
MRSIFFGAILLLVPLHRDSDGLSAAWLPSPAPCEFGFLLTDRFGRIARIQGSLREGPECAPKPPFNCEPSSPVADLDRGAKGIVASSKKRLSRRALPTC